MKQASANITYATFSLLTAIFAIHYAYEVDQWYWATLLGLLAGLTARWTVILTIVATQLSLTASLKKETR